MRGGEEGGKEESCVCGERESGVAGVERDGGEKEE